MKFEIHFANLPVTQYYFLSNLTPESLTQNWEKAKEKERVWECVGMRRGEDGTLTGAESLFHGHLEAVNKIRTVRSTV